VALLSQSLAHADVNRGRLVRSLDARNATSCEVFGANPGRQVFFAAGFALTLIAIIRTKP